MVITAGYPICLQTRNVRFTELPTLFLSQVKQHLPNRPNTSSKQNTIASRPYLGIPPLPTCSIRTKNVYQVLFINSLLLCFISYISILIQVNKLEQGLNSIKINYLGIPLSCRIRHVDTSDAFLFKKKKNSQQNTTGANQHPTIPQHHQQKESHFKMIRNVYIMSKLLRRGLAIQLYDR